MKHAHSTVDVIRRGPAWSAAWGSVAVIFGGGAVATWMATLASGAKVAVWPAWALTTLTAAALYVSFACLAGKWPLNTNSENGESFNFDFILEQIGYRLRLGIVNHGSDGEFYVQVISIRDPLGQRKAPQHWTIPWLEDNSTQPKRILAGGTEMLDFARYDADAVNAELSTGFDGPDHWWFSAVPASIGARYYNLRSRNDLKLQRFSLTIRIMNANSGKYLDRQLNVSVQGSKLACEITPTSASN